MSPPRTPLHALVKPALRVTVAGLTVHTGLSGSAGAILKQAAWEGEQRRDSQSLSALRATALLARSPGGRRRPASSERMLGIGSQGHTPLARVGEGMKRGWLPRETTSILSLRHQEGQPLLLGGSDEPVRGTSIASSPGGQAPPCSVHTTTRVAPRGPLSNPLCLPPTAHTERHHGTRTAEADKAEARVLRKETRREVRKRSP